MELAATFGKSANRRVSDSLRLARDNPLKNAKQQNKI